jgi:hypothetical protein
VCSSDLEISIRNIRVEVEYKGSSRHIPVVEDRAYQGWTVEHSSALDDGLGGQRAINGYHSQCWHGGISDAQPWLIIDMKEQYTVSKIHFTPRQDDLVTSPKHVIFWISDDGTTWTEKLYENSEMPVNTYDTQLFTAPTPKRGRYVKVDIQATIGGPAAIGNLYFECAK